MRVSSFSLLVFTVFLAQALMVPSGAIGAERKTFRFIPFAGTPQFGSADGPKSMATFHQPSGIAVTPDGTVYIADPFLTTIRRVSPEGTVSILAGATNRFGGADGVGQAARFGAPIALACDAAGNVYVADTVAIRRVTPDGVVTTVAGLYPEVGHVDGAGTAARLNRPSALAVDAAGDVWFADSNNHSIRKMSPGGLVTTVAGDSNDPGAVDGTLRSSRFKRPSAIAIDRAGDVYVADENHTVRRIAGGVVTTIAGKAGERGKSDGVGANARFYAISALAIDRDGTILVTDGGNRSVRRIARDGAVTTLAGGGGYGVSNGRGTEVRFGSNFSGPEGLAVHPDGRGKSKVGPWSFFGFWGEGDVPGYHAQRTL